MKDDPAPMRMLVTILHITAQRLLVVINEEDLSDEEVLSNGAYSDSGKNSLQKECLSV